MFLGRVVGPGDPAWLDTDRGLALAWQTNSRATCTSCGTRADEWADDENAYISEHWQCPGCQRIQEHRDGNLERGADDQVLPGQHVFLTPREVYLARMAAKHRTTDD